jgi:hypothetical protein
MGGAEGTGSFAALRMTAGTGKRKNRKPQKRIPFGDDKQNSKSKGDSNGEIRGSLHRAADNEAVRRSVEKFGRR